MKYFLILICMCLLSFSCSKQGKKEHKQTLSLSNITSYTGNALVFFQKESDVKSYHNNVCLILIDERDSSVFKKSSYDIKKAIRGKSIIGVTFFYENMVQLHKTDNKNTRNFEICNIPPDYIYYFKCWISYHDFYETLKYRAGKPLLTDSCNKRYIVYERGKSSLIQCKILR